ncbi:MAG: ABC transporter ATP-binding protein [Pseudomonadota bacterium]
MSAEQIGFIRVTDVSEAEKNIKFISILKWVWQHSKKKVFFMSVAMLSNAALSTLYAYILLAARDFISAAARGEKSSVIIQHVAMLIAVFILVSLLNLISSTFEAIATTTIRRDLEVSCFERLGRANLDFLSMTSSGRISAVIMAEIPQAASITGVVLRCFIRAPLSLFAAAIVLFLNAPYIAMITIIMAPLLGLGVKTFSRLVRETTQRAFTAISDLYAKLNEQLRGIRTVCSLGLMDTYTGRLIHQAHQIARASQKSAIYGAILQSIQELIAMLVFSGLLVWLSHQVVNGKMELGQALLIPATLIFMKNEALKISGGLIHLSKIKSSFVRLHTLLDAPEAIDGHRELEGNLHRIRFQDVSFAYDERSSTLQDINLTLHPGLTVIIGESGSGKSTLCDLVVRLRSPTSGIIYFNDIPLSELKDSCIRSLSALVEQEPFLFEASFRYNLTLENKKCTDEDLHTALALAGVQQLLDELPNGLNSEFGPNGINLSVGQKQRIVLARALLRKPSLLVLDEFTSALDSKTEKEVLATIKELSKNYIILCTSHRPSILEQADWLYTVRDNRIFQVTDEGSGANTLC